MSSGFLAVRLLLGGYIAAHGAQKLFGWFGGHGLGGTGGFMESLGFRPGSSRSRAGALRGWRWCPGPPRVPRPGRSRAHPDSMVVGIGAVHWKNGLFVTSNGVEPPLAWATCAVAVVFAGPGKILGRCRARHRPQHASGWSGPRSSSPWCSRSQISWCAARIRSPRAAEEPEGTYPAGPSPVATGPGACRAAPLGPGAAAGAIGRARNRRRSLPLW